MIPHEQAVHPSGVDGEANCSQQEPHLSGLVDDDDGRFNACDNVGACLAARGEDDVDGLEQTLHLVSPQLLQL